MRIVGRAFDAWFDISLRKLLTLGINSIKSACCHPLCYYLAGTKALRYFVPVCVTVKIPVMSRDATFQISFFPALVAFSGTFCRFSTIILSLVLYYQIKLAKITEMSNCLGYR